MSSTLEHILKRLKLEGTSLKSFPVHVPWFTREDLAVLFHELGFRVGVEIGVEKGLYSQTLCRCNPDLKLYGVDPWDAYPVYGAGGIAQWQSHRALRAALVNIAGFNVELVRKTSEEAAKDFQEESLDFVYVDGDHSFRAVTTDIIDWLPKVRRGGIMAGHDYLVKRHWRGTHVVPVVNALTTIYEVSPWFVFDEETKVPPSWMWVKA